MEARENRLERDNGKNDGPRLHEDYSQKRGGRSGGKLSAHMNEQHPHMEGKRESL